MKIVVLAGGLSPERDVSLSSGSLIANALMDSGHRVCLLDLYLGLNATDFDAAFVIAASGKRFEHVVPAHEPDLERLKRESGNGRALIGQNVIELCKFADLVFLALHGDIGENGKLQAVFDCFGICYTGTGYDGSLLAMDKDLSKILMEQNQILTPKWQIIEDDFESVDFPCVIKPCGCGSSVGVSIVQNKQELVSAVNFAKKYEQKIMAEEMIVGREFSVGVLDGEALPVIEIIPNEGFYDYKNKYQLDLTREVCPAEISTELSDKLKRTAVKTHKALRLGSYSRIDFIVSADGRAFCLEANTLPGMTPTSLLPQEAAAAGIGYRELCEKIAELAGDL